jgi:hypothetical protein
MKRIIIFAIVLLAGCSITATVAYRAGFARAKQLQKGTFVLSLGALQALRVSQTVEATKKLETLCFSTADMLYSDAAYRDQTVTRMFAPELIQYRTTYRTNRSEWTPAEEQLERHLAQWK